MAMATLPTFLRKPGAPAESRAAGPIPVEELFCLRALPNEDVYLFSKRIDNSRVQRQPDPKSSAKCWSTIAIACIVAALFVGVLVPGVANIFTGYKVQDLKAEEQRLLTEQSVMEVDEARLLSREHLEELARSRDMRTPMPGQVMHLDPAGNGKLALNRH
jgi:hypothetical protein